MAHGKPTLINNFWEEGGLNVLGKLVEHPAHLPPDFVAQLLEVRLQLAPAYTRAAVARAAPELVAFLGGAKTLVDPADYAGFDWQLHHLLTVRSGNPIYTLILNGFRAVSYTHLDVYKRQRLVQSATQTARPDDVLTALGFDPLATRVRRVALRFAD